MAEHECTCTNCGGRDHCKIKFEPSRKCCCFWKPELKPIWIPCSERLPEMPIEGLDAMYSDCCLVCDSHEWIGMAYCLTDGKKTWWEFADAQNKVKIDWTEVTHWMPLPEPPKE